MIVIVFVGFWWRRRRRWVCNPILSVLPFCFASFPFPYLSLFLSIGQKRQLQIGVDASSYINLPLYFLSLPLFSFFHFTTHHLAYFPSLRGISFFKLLTLKNWNSRLLPPYHWTYMSLLFLSSFQRLIFFLLIYSLSFLISLTTDLFFLF